jgi:hypothetical protein
MFEFFAGTGHRFGDLAEPEVQQQAHKVPHRRHGPARDPAGFTFKLRFNFRFNPFQFPFPFQAPFQFPFPFQYPFPFQSVLIFRQVSVSIISAKFHPRIMNKISTLKNRGKLILQAWANSSTKAPEENPVQGLNMLCK